METKKLKVGDKIECICNDYIDTTVGNVYEITYLNDKFYEFIDDGSYTQNRYLLDFDKYFKIKEEKENAYKETKGKLFYELDFEFITQMAERMASNKGKYEPFNWQKLMEEKDFKELLQALFRHVLEVMKGNYEDDNRELGHLEAIACDVMMICYQLKKHKKL